MTMLVTRGRKLAFGAALLGGALAFAPVALRAEDAARDAAKDASMPQAAWRANATSRWRRCTRRRRRS